MKYEISTGNNRYDRKLNPETYTWVQLVDKLQKPVVTTEKYEEYIKMPKDQKASIKDKGFFIGGKLSRNVRKKNNIVYRSLLTIDIDNTDSSIYRKIDRIMSMYSFKACCYSTHTHNSKNPRLRLVIPFKKDQGPVTGDEYSYICRVLSKMIDMESIDRTTFQPTRIMYWPSKSKDGEYYFKEWPGKIELTKKMILKSGWENIENWPKHPDEEALKSLNGAKQEDPCTKKGVIGAFCRAFTIQEVLTDDRLLNGIYEETTIENRWTFLGGSTFGGAMVYEDKFMYSWHATDPAGGRLSNSFDILRVHKFDGDEKSTIKFISKLQEVSKEIAAEEFGDDYKDWQENLIRSEKGIILNLYKNIELIIKNEFDLSYDVFSRKFYLENKNKWFKNLPLLEDNDIGQMHKYLEERYNMKSTIQKVENTMKCIGNNNSYHPIKKYLEALKWDGKQRIDKLLVNYFGVDDTPYHRTIMRKTIVAAVARIYKPGIKFDTVLTLVGPTDIGKSSFYRILFKDWFSDSLTLNQMKDKTGSEQILGSWGIELAELAGNSKADVEMVKAFITRQEDRYRPAFGRVVENIPRSCIFLATSNGEDGFLTDITGNRRWLVANVDKKLNQDKLTCEVDQIWAEAVQIWKSGRELLYITDTKIKKEAIKIQREFLVVDDNFEYVRTYLDMPVSADWYDLELHERRQYIRDYMKDGSHKSDGILRNEISIAEIWCELFSKELPEKTQQASKNIAKMLVRLGFDPDRKAKKTIKGLGRQRIFNRLK